MNVTIDVKVPAGFEATGEYRPAYCGEWYLASVKSGNATCATRDLCRKREKFILRKLPEIEGYEYTGEYRQPNQDEWYTLGNMAVRAYAVPCGERHILRELPVAPKGYELTREYRVPTVGEWYLGEMARQTAVQATSTYTPHNKRYILRKIKPDPVAPEGFELTGEYHVPGPGEWFLGNGRAHRSDGFCVFQHPILRKIEAPNGYELTGEKRLPKRGDLYLSYTGDAQEAVGNHGGHPSDTPRHILREKWQAPACFPKGSWVYRNYRYYYLSNHTPNPIGEGGYLRTTGEPIRADVIAELYGQEFTPPPVDCVQVA